MADGEDVGDVVGYEVGGNVGLLDGVCEVFD